MCKMTDKAVFACEVGMQILIYFLATNYKMDINIINANSEIESIENISKIPTTFIKNSKKSDFFLDYVTGDAYEYKNFKNEWEPMMNIGLHKQKLTEKYIERGKYLLRTKSAQRPNSVSVKLEQKYSSMNTEIKVSIQKHNLSHWLVKGLPLQFIVMTNSTWFSHNISVQNQNLELQVLSESEKGYMIIEHGNYIGLSFHVFSKYNETITLLENYIKKKFSETQVITILLNS